MNVTIFCNRAILTSVVLFSASVVHGAHEEYVYDIFTGSQKVAFTEAQWIVGDVTGRVLAPMYSNMSCRAFFALYSSYAGQQMPLTNLFPDLQFMTYMPSFDWTIGKTLELVGKDSSLTSLCISTMLASFGAVGVAQLGGPLVTDYVASTWTRTTPAASDACFAWWITKGESNKAARAHLRGNTESMLTSPNPAVRRLALMCLEGVTNMQRRWELINAGLTDAWPFVASEAMTQARAHFPEKCKAILKGILEKPLSNERVRYAARYPWIGLKTQQFDNVEYVVDDIKSMAIHLLTKEH
ncbi:hypothetical protein GX586_02065 [bacterium]|nr:hypothetical protein [bacterium]